MRDFQLDHGDITGTVGDKVKVTISGITPTNVTDGTITATSQDQTVVAVVPESNSLVADLSLLKAGQTSVTWKSNDGAVTKSIKVTVTAPAQ